MNYAQFYEDLYAGRLGDNMQNEQKKNILGNIYGSRISKNGKWLNLLIVTHENGETQRITCPVRIGWEKDDGKPYVVIPEPLKACINGINIYADSKPTEQQAAAEDVELPF